MREIVLDTETTGMLPDQGDRIIEIGAIELLYGVPTGRVLHQYLDPERGIDPGAEAVHGISREMLIGKPRFRDIAGELTDFLQGARLVIHNAPFDVEFIDMELGRLGADWGRIGDYCDIRCTLAMSRKLLPNERHSLDHLCDYYGIDRSIRTHHGALIDAQLLTYVYLCLQREELS